MEPGRILYTRDGSEIGNAIIKKVISPADMLKHPHLASSWAMKENITLYEVETDFGNTIRFMESEIRSLFTLGKISNYTRWSTDRDNLRKRIS